MLYRDGPLLLVEPLLKAQGGPSCASWMFAVDARAVLNQEATR